MLYTQRKIRVLFFVLYKFGEGKMSLAKVNQKSFAKLAKVKKSLCATLYKITNFYTWLTQCWINTCFNYDNSHSPEKEPVKNDTHNLRYLLTNIKQTEKSNMIEVRQGYLLLECCNALVYLPAYNTANWHPAHPGRHFVSHSKADLASDACFLLRVSCG